MESETHSNTNIPFNTIKYKDQKDQYIWSGILSHLANKEQQNNLKQTQVLYTNNGRLVYNKLWYFDNKSLWCDP